MELVSRVVVSSVVVSLVIFISRAQSVAVPLFNLSFRAICDKGTTGVALFRGALGTPSRPPLSRRFDFSRDVRREAFRRMNS